MGLHEMAEPGTGKPLTYALVLWDLFINPIFGIMLPATSVLCFYNLYGGQVVLFSHLNETHQRNVLRPGLGQTMS